MNRRRWFDPPAWVWILAILAMTAVAILVRPNLPPLRFLAREVGGCR